MSFTLTEVCHQSFGNFLTFKLLRYMERIGWFELITLNKAMCTQLPVFTKCDAEKLCCWRVFDLPSDLSFGWCVFRKLLPVSGALGRISGSLFEIGTSPHQLALAKTFLMLRRAGGRRQKLKTTCSATRKTHRRTEADCPTVFHWSCWGWGWGEGSIAICVFPFFSLSWEAWQDASIWVKFWLNFFSPVLLWAHRDPREASQASFANSPQIALLTGEASGNLGC